MSQFLSEMQEKYTKILKNANLIGFLNRLAKISKWSKLTDSQPLDSNMGLSGGAASSFVNFSTQFYVKLTMRLRHLYEHNEVLAPLHNDSLYVKLPPYLTATDHCSIFSLTPFK